MEELLLHYPPIERHGLIGDRRTAALVAADGTIDWLCLPSYDGHSVFGALLDAQRGGFWRLGPNTPSIGRQRYIDHGAVLFTTWDAAAFCIELTDAMAWPETDRSAERDSCRVLLRRLRCLRGTALCRHDLQPATDFASGQELDRVASGAWRWNLAQHTVGVWTSGEVQGEGQALHGTFTLTAGDEVWAILTLDENPAHWSVDHAHQALDETVNYWDTWQKRLTYTGPRAGSVRRSAMAVHLLSYAPKGSLVAAPTTSLPEHIGGNRNYDYRFAWVRDASLSLAVLNRLGDTQAAAEYMDWLIGLDSSTDAPLQVLYRIDGQLDATERERPDLEGYRGSRPVRFGNHAFQQRQLDAFGYLADCVWMFLQHDGPWRPEYWTLIDRLTGYITANWQQLDSGIWELGHQTHYVSGKVMSWVALERAVRIARHIDRTERVPAWQKTMETIHAEVMAKGWSDHLGAFRQRYDADYLDASVLLIGVMGFLPADHPKLLATADRIAAELTINHFVHRFPAAALPGEPERPKAPSCPAPSGWPPPTPKPVEPAKRKRFWRRAEAIAGPLGLFPEEVDARSGAFLGNWPLLFAQVEYVRAIHELTQQQPPSRLHLLLGKLGQRMRWLLRER